MLSNILQGDSIPRTFELLYQSSHLNLQEDVGNHASHLLFRSAMYSRLGNTFLSDTESQILLDCYQLGCPLDERIKALGRRALLVGLPDQHTLKKLIVRRRCKNAVIAKPSIFCRLPNTSRLVR